MWCCSSSNKNRAPAKPKKVTGQQPLGGPNGACRGLFLTAAGQCGLCFTQEFLLQNAAACPGPPQPLLFSFDADSQSFCRSTTRGRRFCKNGNFSVSFKQKAVLLKRSFFKPERPRRDAIPVTTPGWVRLRTAKSLYGTFALCGTAQSCKSSRRVPS